MSVASFALLVVCLHLGFAVSRVVVLQLDGRLNAIGFVLQRILYLVSGHHNHDSGHSNTHPNAATAQNGPSMKPVIDVTAQSDIPTQCVEWPLLLLIVHIFTMAYDTTSAMACGRWCCVNVRHKINKIMWRARYPLQNVWSSRRRASCLLWALTRCHAASVTPRLAAAMRARCAPLEPCCINFLP